MKHHSAPIRLIGMAVRFGIWRFWTQWSFWILLIPTTNKMGKTDRYFQIFPIPITNKMGKSSYFALRFQVPVHVHKTCRPHPRVPLRMLDPQHLPVPELHRSLIRDPKIWDKKRVQKLASKVSFSMGPYLFHGKWMKYDEIHWNPACRPPESVKISTFPFHARPLVTWSFGPLMSLGPAPFGFQLRKQNWIPANFELPGACTARWRGKSQHLQLQTQVKSWTLFVNIMILTWWWYQSISKWKNMLTIVHILYETHLV